MIGPYDVISWLVNNLQKTVPNSLNDKAQFFYIFLRLILEIMLSIARHLTWFHPLARYQASSYEYNIANIQQKQLIIILNNLCVEMRPVTAQGNKHVTANVTGSVEAKNFYIIFFLYFPILARSTTALISAT